MTIIREGLVVSGDYSGWKITIDDDRNGSTGGYYIYLTHGKNQGFDHWFENEECLNNQLIDFNVEWIK